MLDLVGAAAVLAACAWLALSLVSAMNRHLRALEALSSALSMMRGEISCRLTPMPELFERLKNEAPEPAAALFSACAEKLPALGDSSLAKIWAEAARGTFSTALEPDELRAVEDVGLCLGRFEAREQAESIARAVEALIGFKERAEAKKRVESRLYPALSIALGLMLVIILI